MDPFQNAHIFHEDIDVSILSSATPNKNTEETKQMIGRGDNNVRSGSAFEPKSIRIVLYGNEEPKNNSNGNEIIQK